MAWKLFRRRNRDSCKGNQSSENRRPNPFNRGELLSQGLKEEGTKPFDPKQHPVISSMNKEVRKELLKRLSEEKVEDDHIGKKGYLSMLKRIGEGIAGIAVLSAGLVFAYMSTVYDFLSDRVMGFLSISLTVFIGYYLIAKAFGKDILDPKFDTSRDTFKEGKKE